VSAKANKPPKPELTEWEADRGKLIQAAMDRGELKLALALTLETQVALGLVALRAGGFLYRVTPLPTWNGVMPIRELGRLCNEARAHVEATGADPSREDAAGLNALEGVFYLRALLGRVPATRVISDELLFGIVLSAGRCGGADSILAGERQGFFERAERALKDKKARSAGGRSTAALRPWWRAMAREEWTRLAAIVPRQSVKMRENAVVAFLEAAAEGRRVPKARGLKEARLAENWDVPLA